MHVRQTQVFPNRAHERRAIAVVWPPIYVTHTLLVAHEQVTKRRGCAHTMLTTEPLPSELPQLRPVPSSPDRPAADRGPCVAAWDRLRARSWIRSLIRSFHGQWASDG